LKIKYPLSVKIRLHESVENTISIIQKLNKVGIKSFTVHARYAWQKGDKRGLADWQGLKRIRDSFPDIFLIGNGNIGTFEDFSLMIQQTGVDAAMAGYGALVMPCIFQALQIPLSLMIDDYLEIARKHRNHWIDIQRHVQWMLKTVHSITPMERFQLFKCRNLQELRNCLESFQPPIRLSIDCSIQHDDKILFAPGDKNANGEEEHVKDKLKFVEKHSPSTGNLFNDDNTNNEDNLCSVIGEEPSLAINIDD